MKFSNAGKMVLQNWAVVQDIHEIEIEVANYLENYIRTFDKELKKCKWWDSKWKFVSYDAGQSYITRPEWKRGESDAIWIGIWNFNADALFGTKPPASFYVYVEIESPQLVSALQKHFEGESDIIGTITTKTLKKGGYIIQHNLRKCLPEEVERFEEVVGTSILAFFEYYAKREKIFSNILNNIEKKKS